MLTVASLGWVLRNRAWTPFYLVRYWRFLLLRMRHPDVVTEGFVFLGRRVELSVRPGYGRIVLGRWVHLGDDNRLRAHEGTLRVGDKTVFGRDNTVNCYLDIEFGPRCLVSDWVYVCDFDHGFADLDIPIKDQGLVKEPVRIGADVWIGTKASVLRGSRIGHGSVVGAHAVVRGEVPAESVAVGVPARVVRSRRPRPVGELLVGNMAREDEHPAVGPRSEEWQGVTARKRRLDAKDLEKQPPP